jgi:hypothetical protein
MDLRAAKNHGCFYAACFHTPSAVLTVTVSILFSLPALRPAADRDGIELLMSDLFSARLYLSAWIYGQQRIMDVFTRHVSRRTNGDD